ncbi:MULTISPECIES: hypothetical protein [Pseudomonas]|uniref:hypothetical protein n=1 Tax=Pseudomonas TaxID=286 RepID=UPI000F0347C4|nr:hypothetical protein [Pseudomonas viridiflava]MBD8681201.1 hypothetical protein [Pseudomonas sp. CFBP 13719]
MNAQKMIESWERHEFGACLSHLALLSDGDLLQLSGEIPDAKIGAFCSIFFFSRHMTNEQTSAYARLLEHKFQTVARRRNPQSVMDIGKACSLLSLCVPELMESSYERKGLQAMKDIFRAYTASLACLKVQVEFGEPALINKGMVERWAEALTYDFGMIDKVDPDTLAFINKMVTLRGDRVASTMIYALKQKASHSPAEERPGEFSDGIEQMVNTMASHDLLIVPKDVESLVKEADHLPQYYLNHESKKLWAARSSLLTHLLDPDEGGRWLGNSYSKSGRKVLDPVGLKRLRGAIESALDKPESQGLEHLAWRSKVGLINAMSRLPGNQNVTENLIVNLIRPCEDDHVKWILSQVTRKASLLIARGIGRKIPERVSLITPRLGEKLLAVDLGL